MAMSTSLMAVTDEEIEKLRKKPEGILKQKSKINYGTHLFGCVNFFLTGDAYGEDHPLGAALSGKETIETAALAETGWFGVVTAKEATKVLALLTKVDLKKLKKKIESAQESDWDDLSDAEVDDADLLVDEDDPVATLLKEIKKLTEFYEKATKEGLGVVMYTD